MALDWTARIRDAFESDAETAVVCGRVHVPEELAREGFAMSFEPLVREWQGRFPPPDRDWGITANLSVRRSVLDKVGRFDPFLGPGAPLLCGEEPDLLFRVLEGGLKVVNATEVEVTHLGIRAHGEESRQLWDIYGAGTAAALFKHVRLGNTKAMRLWLQHLTTMARVMTGNLLTGTRPIGARYTLSFLSGTRRSLRFDIDRVRPRLPGPSRNEDPPLRVDPVAEGRQPSGDEVVQDAGTRAVPPHGIQQCLARVETDPASRVG